MTGDLATAIAQHILDRQIVCAACGCNGLDGGFGCSIICGEPEREARHFEGILPRAPAEPIDPQPLTRQIRRARARKAGR